MSKNSSFGGGWKGCVITVLSDCSTGDARLEMLLCRQAWAADFSILECCMGWSWLSLAAELSTHFQDVVIHLRFYAGVFP
jgi:hypothetical protein